MASGAATILVTSNALASGLCQYVTDKKLDKMVKKLLVIIAGIINSKVAIKQPKQGLVTKT
jgi:hypothetical protein